MMEAANSNQNKPNLKQERTDANPPSSLSYVTQIHSQLCQLSLKNHQDNLYCIFLLLRAYRAKVCQSSLPFDQLTSLCEDYFNWDKEYAKRIIKEGDNKFWHIKETRDGKNKGNIRVYPIYPDQIAINLYNQVPIGAVCDIDIRKEFYHKKRFIRKAILAKYVIVQKEDPKNRIPVSKDALAKRLGVTKPTLNKYIEESKIRVKENFALVHEIKSEDVKNGTPRWKRPFSRSLLRRASKNELKAIILYVCYILKLNNFTEFASKVAKKIYLMENSNTKTNNSIFEVSGNTNLKYHIKVIKGILGVFRQLPNTYHSKIVYSKFKKYKSYISGRSIDLRSRKSRVNLAFDKLSGNNVISAAPYGAGEVEEIDFNLNPEGRGLDKDLVKFTKKHRYLFRNRLRSNLTSLEPNPIPVEDIQKDSKRGGNYFAESRKHFVGYWRVYSSYSGSII